MKPSLEEIFARFNRGEMRGRDTESRQALLDSFSVLPNRYLDASGNFIEAGEPGIGGIDKFPSLLSVDAARLFADGNRIVPSAMIRSGTYIGKRNIIMFHAAINIAAYVGDDNLIDSHASVGSSAQIGNKNKIASFVSLEGVLSPANAVPVEIGDENFIGTFARIGTGIRLGQKNFIASGVNLSLGTKLRDCRDSSARGQYITLRDLGEVSNLCITPNNATRNFNDVDLVPGEYALFENSPEFMARFEGDKRIAAKG